MDWRLARSLEKLRDEINAQFPDRSKASDGSIGNAAHAARSSDHNPWVHDHKGQPIVTAIDVTNDPEHGLDSEKLAEALLASRDPRIKYVISNRKIASGADGPQPWVWRKYGGANAHNHHVHVSVEDSEQRYDSTSPWDLTIGATKDGKTPPSARMPVIRIGDSGAGVDILQGRLNAHGFSLEADGVFGPATDKAVKAFQKASGLDADGVVGPYTWEKLGE